jgi:hypothetical protein
MSNLISALARLRAFRSTWEDDAEIDEESGLTAADLDTILAAAEGADEDASGDLLNGDDYELGKLA